MSRIENFEAVIEQLKPKLRDYLEEKGINTKKNFTCIHPDHNDGSPSAGLVPGSDFTKWNCFGCGAKGDIFDAIHYLEGKPIEGPQFIEEVVGPLAERYGIDVKFKELTEDERYRIDSFTAYKKAAAYIGAHLNDDVRAEFDRRGWDHDMAQSHLIGTVPSFSDYKEHMLSLGFTYSFLDGIDLMKEDLFTERNMFFTVADDHGRPCGFGARNLHHDKTNKQSKKYINTSAKCQIYEKSKRLYNIHNAKRKPGTLYVMEGYADVETAIQKGIEKVVCVGGTAFTDYHVIELSRMGITDITLCFDGDERGLERIDKILEKFTEHRQFSVHIIAIPDELDPDDYLREYGADAFLNLKRWSAFEWKLNSYDDRIDTFLIRREIVPIIAAEYSPIERERMGKVLSDRIGISANAIMDEVSQILNEKDSEKAKEQKAIIDSLIKDLKTCPTDWRLSMTAAQQNLETLSIAHTEEQMSISVYLKELEIIQEEEENFEEEHSTFYFEGMRELSAAVEGDWRSTLNVIGGGANTGKTAIMSNMAIGLARMEEDAPLVIFHTIDDTKKQFTTRLVCQFAAEIMPNITLNMIKNPGKYPNQKAINKARDYAYDQVKQLVAQERLFVIDGDDGKATLAYADNIIGFYQRRYAGKKRIIYMLDNFHRLRDFVQYEERIRFKKLSTAAKDIAKKYEIPIWATMEYSKHGAWAGRPTNNSIAESAAMEYDANLIAHVYNDLHSQRENAEIYFTRTTDEGTSYKAPRIEMIFGKNKLNSFKGNLYFDFYTEQSRFQPVPSSVVQEDIKIARELKEEERKTGGRYKYANAS
jgi:DNA primase